MIDLTTPRSPAHSGYYEEIGDDDNLRYEPVTDAHRCAEIDAAVTRLTFAEASPVYPAAS